MNGHFLRVTGVDLCQSKKHMAVLLTAENEKITIYLKSYQQVLKHAHNFLKKQ